MKIIFISNYLNNHQLPLVNEFINNSNYFIFYEYSKNDPSDSYKVRLKDYEFIKNIKEENDEDIIKNIYNADIVIIGHRDFPYKYLRKRIESNKIMFRFSERFLKDKGLKGEVKNILRKLIYKFKLNKENKNKNSYLLCAGHYANKDYNNIGLYKDRSLTWGYFPKTIKRKKTINQQQPLKLLWVGRFIDWKYPLDAVKAVHNIINNKYDVILNMVGDGEEFENVKRYINKHGLSNKINLLGSLTYDEVQQCYKESEVFLFTSDKGEGWGAVLNEAMSNSLIPIASNLAGSTQTLIENEVNGYIYESNNINKLSEAIEKYINVSRDEKQAMSNNAYDTMRYLWSAEEAVKRLISFSESKTRYSRGPISYVDNEK